MSVQCTIDICMYCMLLFNSVSNALECYNFNHYRVEDTYSTVMYVLYVIKETVYITP